MWVCQRGAYRELFGILSTSLRVSREISWSVVELADSLEVGILPMELCRLPFVKPIWQRSNQLAAWFFCPYWAERIARFDDDILFCGLFFFLVDIMVHHGILSKLAALYVACSSWSAFYIDLFSFGTSISIEVFFLGSSCRSREIGDFSMGFVWIRLLNFFEIRICNSSFSLF